MWSAVWSGLLLVFLLIIFRTKDRKLYLLYFLFGMIFGFYFDAISVYFHYYTYADLFFKVVGVPLSMTIAEGFAVVITVRLFEFPKETVGNFS